jgi:hypothetical protein
MKTATQRTYTDVETGHNTRLYTSNDASKYHLIYEGQHKEIADGCEVNGFYLMAFTDGEIKLNTGRRIALNTGNFYNLKKGEKVVSRKFAGMKNFTKI